MPIPFKRCMLFTPALRPERVRAGALAGCDSVCIDLEDSIPIDRKDEARDLAFATLAEPGSGAPLALRINSLRSRAGLRDLLRLAETPVANRPAAVIVPKVSAAAEIAQLVEVLADAPSAGRPQGPEVLAVIETADGLQEVEAIAAAPGLSGLLFGAADLAMELGCRLDWEPLLPARARVVHAAARAGLPVLDVPHLDVADEAGLRATAAAARDLGFAGKTAIHPHQIAPILEVFTPDAATLAEARRVIDAFERSAGGVVLLDGRMIDRPVVRAMERILAAAGSQATGKSSEQTPI
jgi:(S)-citramalyl-CoA lyase